jgi:hypothetical protein
MKLGEAERSIQGGQCRQGEEQLLGTATVEVVDRGGTGYLTKGIGKLLGMGGQSRCAPSRPASRCREQILGCLYDP